MSSIRRAVAPASLLVLALMSTGCPDDSTCAPRVVTTSESCTTTQDCIDGGFVGLTCLNGVCARGCTRDDDCVLEDPEDQNKECASDAQDDKFICEAQLCTVGCPSVACADGEQCINGRCAIFFESFELPMGQEVVTPKSLGWDGIERDLENRETTIVFSGAEGCIRGDERCAGPAADGLRYIALERVPTPAQGTPENAVSCRACACCLECRLNPPLPRDAAKAQIPNCPGMIDPPEAPTCEANIPAVCQDVCTACDACTNATGRMVDLDSLLTCERQAAPKICSGCQAYDQCVANEFATRSCMNASEPCRAEADCPACIVRTCDPMRGPCFACRDAIQCEIDTPGASMCRTLKMTCDAQDDDGCYSTPIARARSELTDDEQALLSPAVAKLAGVAGRVVLELEYVPFNIGEKWTRVKQGEPRDQWRSFDQEVKVQLCATACDRPDSWMDAASFPPASQKQNGLSFAGQSSIDWRSNRVSIEIPEAMRTADFRFRFVPLLADDARVGIDNVIVRRK